MAESAPAVIRTLALVVLSAACASTPPSSLVPTDLLAAMQVADELERDRHFTLAREQLVAAAEYADTVERGESLRVRACELWAREGSFQDARACYQGLTLAGDEMRALANHRVAVLDLEAGDVAGARAAMVAVVHEYPATDAAKRALRGARALAHEQGGALSEVELLLVVVDELRARGGSEGPIRELYLEALVGAARRRVEDLEDPAAAEELLAWAVASEVASHWLDDAIIWRARVLVQLGQHDAALAHYRRIVDERESSWFVGSYDSVFLDDALYERAELLEQLGRTEQAREAFEELMDEVPDSRLLDDAAFRAARLAGERAALERFVADFPDSRHVRAARELLEAP